VVHGAIEEVQTLVAEVATCVVVDDVRDQRETVDMTDVDERLQLVPVALSQSWRVGGGCPRSGSSRLAAAR